MRVGDTVNFSEHSFKSQLEESEALPTVTADYVASSIPKAKSDHEGSETDDDADGLDKVSSSMTVVKTAVADTPAISVATGTKADAGAHARPPSVDSYLPFSTAHCAISENVDSSALLTYQDNPSMQAAESQSARFRRVVAEDQARHAEGLFDAVEAAPTSDVEDDPLHARASDQCNGTGLAANVEVSQSPQKGVGRDANYGSKRSYILESVNAGEEVSTSDDDDEDAEDIVACIARDGSVHRDSDATSNNVISSEAYDEARAARATARRSLKRKLDPYGLPVGESSPPMKRKGSPRQERPEVPVSDGGSGLSTMPEAPFAQPSSAAEAEEDAAQEEPSSSGSSSRAEDVEVDVKARGKTKRKGDLAKPVSDVRHGREPASKESESTGDTIAVARTKSRTKKSSPQFFIPSSATKPSVPPPSSAVGSSTPGKTPKVLLSSCSLPQKVETWARAQVTNEVPSKRAYFVCVVTSDKLKLTPKVLRSLASGKLIATDDWVKDSEAFGSWLDPADYVHEEVADTLDLDRSKLFKGMKMYFTVAARNAYGSEGWSNIDALARTVVRTACNLATQPRALHPADMSRGMDNTVFIGLNDNEDAVSLHNAHGKTVYHKDLLTQSVLRGELDLDSTEFKLELATTTAKKGRKKKAR